MFHVELRQFPHVARTFNLTREELHARILRPWVTGGSIELQDRSWSSDKGKVTIVEGPELLVGDLGLGRGWNNAAKGGEDVTAALVAEAEREIGPSPADELKEEIVAACARSPIALPAVVELVAARNPQRRASELLGLTEQAVWELLHQGRLAMLHGAGPVAREEWQPLLLTWGSWMRSGACEVTVTAA
jgi:hypothetical protein